MDKLLFEFKVPGKITGKARPRVTKWGTHNTQQTITYENWVKTCFLEHLNTLPNKYKSPIETYLKVEIIAYYPKIKSMSKKNQKLADENILRPDKKPDCDNIAKIILDALNNLAYKDDKQVVDLHVSKYYSNTSYVEILIYEVE